MIYQLYSAIPKQTKVAAIVCHLQRVICLKTYVNDTYVCWSKWKRRKYFGNQQHKYISLEQQLSGILINSLANMSNTSRRADYLVSSFSETFFCCWCCCFFIQIASRMQQQCKRLYLCLFRSIAMQTSSMVMSLSIHDFNVNIDIEHRSNTETNEAFRIIYTSTHFSSVNVQCKWSMRNCYFGTKYFPFEFELESMNKVNNIQINQAYSGASTRYNIFANRIAHRKPDHLRHGEISWQDERLLLSFVLSATAAGD